MFDAQPTAFAVEILHLKTHDFAAPQATLVRQSHHDLALGVRAGGEDASHLAAGQQLGDALGALGHDQSRFESRPTQHLHIEKAKGV
ncbi:hypothetical protein GCM10007392_45580 [Saccharospirillum salsuginis]|uniref:Uncharacterized protein n=1 Tax=Saccharospirillum salsuginis TaxID=418750 RepID=A0A918NJR2_9GAMM|nr:hypothetical protein GCM10007392_45580 [Saccharospirillum salsuginis]